MLQFFASQWKGDGGEVDKKKVCRDSVGMCIKYMFSCLKQVVKMKVERNGWQHQVM